MCLLRNTFHQKVDSSPMPNGINLVEKYQLFDLHRFAAPLAGKRKVE
jgi:hypothetical protein